MSLVSRRESSCYLNTLHLEVWSLPRSGRRLVKAASSCSLLSSVPQSSATLFSFHHAGGRSYRVEWLDGWHIKCPRSLDPFHIITYNIKWVKTSWTHSIYEKHISSMNIGSSSVLFTWCIPRAGDMASWSGDSGSGRSCCRRSQAPRRYGTRVLTIQPWSWTLLLIVPVMYYAAGVQNFRLSQKFDIPGWNS